MFRLKTNMHNIFCMKPSVECYLVVLCMSKSEPPKAKHWLLLHTFFVIFSDIKFNNFPTDPTSSHPHRSWTYWYVHHVTAALLNHTYFNHPSTWTPPSDVLTTKNASTPWAQINYNWLNIYKLFCFQNITTTMNQYFLGVKTVTVKHWKYTFPILKPVQNDSEFQAIVLDSNMYNINAMESVASAMEGSVIGARNVAMMVKIKYFNLR